MKNLAKIFLTVILLFNQTYVATAYADTKDQLMTEDEEGALHHANFVLYQLLWGSLMAASPYETVLKNISKADAQWSEDIQKILANTDKLGMTYTDLADQIEAGNVSLAQLQTAIDSYIENYRKALLESRKVISRIHSSNDAVNMARQMVTTLTQDVQAICQKGVSIDYIGKDLPALTYPGSQWKLGVNIVTDSNGKNGTVGPGDKPNNEYGMMLFPLFERIGGKDPSVWNGLGTMGIMYGAHWLVAPSVKAYMAAQGFLASGMTTSAATWLAAGGVTIAIAVALLVIEQSMARNESRDAADRVQQQFFNKANESTVSRFVMRNCKQIEGSFTGLEQKAQNILSKKSELDKFEKRRNESEKIINKLGGLIEAADKASDKNNPSKNAKEADELQAYIRSVGFKGIAEILSVSLLSIEMAAQAAQKYSDEFVKNEIKNGDSLFQKLKKHRDTLIQQRNQLFEWAREYQLQSQDGHLSDKLKLSQDGMVEMTTFVAEWQKTYGTIISSYLIHGNVDSAKNKRQLREIIATGQQLIIKYGNNDLMKLIISRSESLIGVL